MSNKQPKFFEEFPEKDDFQEGGAFGLMTIQDHLIKWWSFPKRMELDCPICGKARAGVWARQACFVIDSSPIVHDLFNDHSWCNE